MSLVHRIRARDLTPETAPLVLVGVLLLVLLVSAVASLGTGPAPARGLPSASAAAPPFPASLAQRPAILPSLPAPKPGSNPTPGIGAPGQTLGQEPSARTRPSNRLEPAASVPPWIPRGIVAHTAHPAGRWVALTFDDGPTPAYTPQVLALLRQYQVKATFCMIGEQAREFPALVRQVLAEGHRLCNHTMTHDEGLPHRSRAQIRGEIRGADQAIHDAVPGAPIDYFRAPGGAWSPLVRHLAAGYGMASIGWSVDTRDWERPGVPTILANIRNELSPGGVILMHDGGGDRTQSVEALRQLLANLTAQHYRFDFPA